MSLESLLTDLGESEGLDLDLQAVLDVLAQWMEKALCFLQKHEDPDKASTEIEEEDQIFQADMMVVDGMLQVLIHAVVQDFSSIIRDVFEVIFSLKSADSSQANALAHVTLGQIEEFSNTFDHEIFFPRTSYLSPHHSSGACYLGHR